MGNDVLVTNGLKAGDRYIVEGAFMRVQPGMQVNTVSVDGVTRQAETAPPAADDAKAKAAKDREDA
jgi:hypothetical protein